MKIRITTRAWQFTSIVMTGSVLATLGLYRIFAASPAHTTQFSLAVLLWFLLEISPLLLVVPGIVNLHRKSIFWATLVSMLYVVEGIYLAAAPLSRSTGISVAVFALGMFIACTYLLRGLTRHVDS